MVPLFLAVVTVMAKWFLHNALYTILKGGYTVEKYSVALIRKVMTYKLVLRPMKPESCVLARILLW